MIRRKASEKMTTQDSAQNLKQRLLSLIEKADFLVEDDLNALMEVLPDKDKLLLKVFDKSCHMIDNCYSKKITTKNPHIFTTNFK